MSTFRAFPTDLPPVPQFSMGPGSDMNVNLILIKYMYLYIFFLLWSVLEAVLLFYWMVEQAFLIIQGSGKCWNGTKYPRRVEAGNIGLNYLGKYRARIWKCFVAIRWVQLVTAAPQSRMLSMVSIIHDQSMVFICWPRVTSFSSTLNVVLCINRMLCYLLPYLQLTEGQIFWTIWDVLGLIWGVR